MMPALLMRRSSGSPLFRKRSAKAATEDGSVSSIASTVARVPTAALAFPTSRAGTITRAPAEESARVVSRPIPADPPVTMAVLPRRSWPRMTSAAVEDALKSDLMGACGLGMRA